MKIRMLVAIAGHAEPNYGLDDFSFAAGEVVDVDKKLATAWIEGGLAEKASKSADVAQETNEGSTGESA
jgi:hypothetical protein